MSRRTFVDKTKCWARCWVEVIGRSPLCSTVQRLFVMFVIFLVRLYLSDSQFAWISWVSVSLFPGPTESVVRALCVTRRGPPSLASYLDSKFLRKIDAVFNGGIPSLSIAHVGVFHSFLSLVYKHTRKGTKTISNSVCTFYKTFLVHSLSYVHYCHHSLKCVL